MLRHLRSRPGVWFAGAMVLLFNGAFLLNNLAPYLGLNYAGAMTMYSNLSPRGENHLIMPSLTLSEGGSYVRILRVSTRDLKTPAAEQFDEFADYAARRGRMVHINFLRYHAARVCESAPQATLSLTLASEQGGRMEIRNACAEPTMLSYSLLSGYPECRPGCDGELRKWAASNSPTGSQ